jgi:hypothetical protein
MLADVHRGSKQVATYQLTWKALPGLRGICCSEFRAAATTAPDNERGVAVELATEAERDALLAELERHFAAQRFSNAATAFETVKASVLEWHAKRNRENGKGKMENGGTGAR